MDAQAGLRLCCSQTSEDRFSRTEAQIRMVDFYCYLIGVQADIYLE